MTYAVPAPALTVLPVEGSEAVFPVGRIFCVGRNYAEHTREMGHDPDREPPFFFMKPATSIVAGGGDMPYPPGTADLHHEMELVAAIGTGGRDIREEDALDHVFGYAAGLDMTRRDLQGVAKQLGRPWEVGKAFDHAAPCSPVVMASEIGHPETGAVRLRVNGELRQDGDISQMIWRPAGSRGAHFGALRPHAGRPHHDRHPGRRGRRLPRRPPRRRSRGRRADRGEGGLGPCNKEGLAKLRLRTNLASGSGMRTVQRSRNGANERPLAGRRI